MTLPRLLFTVLVAIAAAVATTAPASAAVCADYSNQAAAQQAGDTRDADRDGVLCESLPCPCSSAAGGGGQTSAPTPNRRPSVAKPLTPKRPRLGRPILLGKQTKTTGCHVRGALPDPACTPGAVYPGATTRVICRTGY